MSISKWLDQSQEVNEKHYDVVIVGAGIAGLSTAYWLQKKNRDLKIAILEKNRLAFGASGRNAGFVTCGSVEHFMKLEADFGLAKATEIWKFSEENHRLLKEEIIQDQEAAVDYQKTGSCTVAPSDERWALYQKMAGTMKQAGIAVSEMDAQGMKSQYGVEGFAGGIEYAGDGFIHPVKLLERLRRLVRADLFESTEVFAIESSASGHQEKIKTDRGSFCADQVVVTVNAYLPLIFPAFASVVEPGRGQIVMTEPLPKFVKGPCYLTKHLAYFRQLPTGELIVGGFRNLDRASEKTYVDQTTPLIQEALLEFIKTHFPSAARAQLAYRWSGIMGFTPDGQMLLGSLPGDSRRHVMAGCSGHGLGLSFHAAKILVESMSGGSLPPHLNLRRFESAIKFQS